MDIEEEEEEKKRRRKKRKKKKKRERRGSKSAVRSNSIGSECLLTDSVLFCSIVRTDP